MLKPTSLYCQRFHQTVLLQAPLSMPFILHLRGGKWLLSIFRELCWNLVLANSLHHMPLSDFWKGTLVLWTDVTRVHTSPTWRSLPSVLHPLVSLPQASPPRAPSASSQGCSQTPVLGEGVHSPIPHGLCFPRLNSISVVV